MIVALLGWQAERDIEITGAKAQDPKKAKHTLHEDVIALPRDLQLRSGTGLSPY